ncbi:hypothetical protein ACJX0J_012627, partial [Zea mays]
VTGALNMYNFYYHSMISIIFTTELLFLKATPAVPLAITFLIKLKEKKPCFNYLFRKIGSIKVSVSNLEPNFLYTFYSCYVFFVYDEYYMFINCCIFLIIAMFLIKEEFLSKASDPHDVVLEAHGQ